ncbi:5'-methylthioadenosine/adenosylhomocysteine nucleosidase [Sporosarcina pasteurii]|uniref:adenosylhomocysteine nucleosidase n=2 Tax=Sporosarcina TaxID=1569 RepID=A0A380BC96_SPOPA|nr:5'-methylthioadenosine/adenosylhomocysteine nucleosidase [Sporosarcina pasteurii]MDS9472923.1 5'-methylthioadenosine/adenosylhomocysteine nucleosidase [Sporosarcina pasteurii]QBQ06466.1 5'-methylthioadenosine/adenosylhomocysteine nucleosidase [Sporosarcina pasteurii]SUI98414.1 5'-methylthioadenosine/S-adenosylhomocysteine nucleosidase [Sporosarcina pasteurii]
MKNRMNIKFFTLIILAVFALFGCSTKQDGSTATSSEQPEEQSNTEQSNERVIGIIGAMIEEVEILRDKMEIENTETIAGMEFYQGTLGGENIVLVQSGVGKVNAAACAQALVDHFGADYLINSGVAGGLSPDVTIGDIVISTDAVQHDFDITAFGEKPGIIARMDTSYFEADEKLIQLAQSAAEGLTDDINVYQGRIASGDQFIASPERKEWITENFSPYAVEMEGAAIAHVAFLNEVPFVIIRAISDDAGGEADVKYEDFVKVAAENASKMIEEMIKSASESL